MTFDDCPCSGKNLARLVQPAIMAVLADGPVHGYLVADRLAAMASFDGRAPDAAGVYRQLRAMEERGVVEAAWDLSDSGPARRLYRLTDDGRACLEAWADTLRQYRDAIDGLLAALDRAADPVPAVEMRPPAQAPRPGPTEDPRSPEEDRPAAPANNKGLKGGAE